MVNAQVDVTLESLKQGSEAAFKKVYEDNRAKFINFARRYNLSDDDTIDIYQDAYIVFYNNIKSGKIESFTSSISTYLFSVGKYLIFDRMKKNNRTVNADLSIVRDEDALVDALDIDEIDELTTEQQLLRKYFDALGKKCQNLLTLFYYRGFTIKEIVDAEDYNNENVVKSAKSRCMKTLKAHINTNAN